MCGPIVTSTAPSSTPCWKSSHRSWTSRNPRPAFTCGRKLPQDDETFTRELYARENVLVLPGSYLSRDAQGTNPGRKRVRMALVAPLAECVEAAKRIRSYIRIKPDPMNADRNQMIYPRLSVFICGYTRF